MKRHSVVTVFLNALRVSLTLFVAHSAYGQFELSEGSKIELGNSYILKSEILKEDREVWIYTPLSMSKSKVEYPVIYVFDAESIFWTTTAAVRFMNYSSEMPQMPEAIVVGITNTNRMRDMPIPQQFEKVKGAENFKAFLTDELMPSIENKFPTNGLNIAIGHSQGGLFVNYLASENPDLFRMIVSLDAPMTINKKLSMKMLDKLKTNCDLQFATIHKTFGWGDLLDEVKGCWNINEKEITNDNHETMPFEGIYRGLQYLFRGYTPEEKDLTLKQLDRHYKDLSRKYKAEMIIPSSVLLASVRRRTLASRKQDAFALLDHYELQYGETKRTVDMRKKAEKIEKGPDPRVDYYLSLPMPDHSRIQSYLGKWKGMVYVPGGTDTKIELEILIEGDKLKVISNILTGNGQVAFTSTSAFAGIDKDGSFVYGRKHGAGGVYVSSIRISKDNDSFKGTEDLIGVTPPPGVGDFKPNTLEFKRVK